MDEDAMAGEVKIVTWTPLAHAAGMVSVDAWAVLQGGECALCGADRERGQGALVVDAHAMNGVAAFVCWDCLPTWANRERGRRAGRAY